MNVLISLLGQTPGAVTGAYYALARDGGVPIDRLITLSTQNAYGAENYVRRELERWAREGHAAPDYGEKETTLPEWSESTEHYRQSIRSLEAACRLRIPYDDVNKAEAVSCFRETLRVLLAEVYREHDVHVCVAGGRKSMAANATLAAQLYGYSVKGLYHLYVQPEITLKDGTTLRPEESGTVESLGALHYADQRDRLLRPEPGEVRLVPISFFQLETQDGNVRLALRGEMQEYLLEYLADNEALLALCDTNRDVIPYVFEEKVAEHLRQVGWNATPRMVHDWFSGDFDVWAERGDEILICECKHQDRADAPVEARKFKQAQDRLRETRRRFADRQISAWVVSNSRVAEPAARTYMLAAADPVEFRSIRFNHGMVQKLQGGKWIASLREPWLEGDFERQSPPEALPA